MPMLYWAFENRPRLPVQVSPRHQGEVEVAGRADEFAVRAENLHHIPQVVLSRREMQFVIRNIQGKVIVGGPGVRRPEILISGDLPVGRPVLPVYVVENLSVAELEIHGGLTLFV